MLSPVNALLLAYGFGVGIWWWLLFGLCLAPLVIAGSEVGMRVGALMSRHRLRAAAFALLLLLALVSVLGPLLGTAG